MNGIAGKRGSMLAIGILALLPVTAADRGEKTWEIGNVTGALGGSYASMQIDQSGNLHVAYIAEAVGMLQYSFWDHNVAKWFTMDVDRGSGFCALALDSKQRPHISYPLFGKLKHAYWDGTIWQKETIQLPSKDVQFYTSIAIDAKDNPTISFYEHIAASEEMTIRLRTVTRNGSVWELSTVDQDKGSGKFNSVAVDSAGRPRIAYANVQYETCSLRYAEWNGTRWVKEILEGAGIPGTYRQAVTLLLDKKGNPHLSYFDVLSGIAKYATRVNGKWQVHSVEPVGAVAYPDRNGMALDDDGNPYISYYDSKNGVLKLAHLEGQRWLSEVVDTGYAGFTSSLLIRNGEIWLTYSGGANEPLRFARRRLAQPAARQPEARPPVK
jgi:hypothetical protein